jgi:hypothetical protein
MATVAVQFTGDAGKLEREITKLQAKAQELQAKLRGVGSASRSAADDGSAGFASLFGKVTAVSTAIMGAGGTIAAVNALRAALDQMKEAADVAGKAVEGAFKGRAGLAQLSPDQKTFVNLTEETKRMRTQFGLTSARDTPAQSFAKKSGITSRLA